MTEPREDALLQFPGIDLAGFQHVAAVIGFDYDRGTATQPFGDERGDVTEIQQRRDLHARVCGGEAEIVDRVMGNRERVKIDLANAKVSARLNFFDAIAEAFYAAARLFGVYAKAFAYI